MVDRDDDDFAAALRVIAALVDRAGSDIVTERLTSVRAVELAGMLDDAAHGLRERAEKMSVSGDGS